MIEVESLQVEEMHEALTKALENAYISTADESRIAQWERYLGIVPLPQGEDTLELWLEDRKETILARLYSVQKLNTKSIAEVVSIFTGGDAKSYFKDGVIHVLIRPPKSNKQYKFANVEQELTKRIPAHLTLRVERDYYTWLELKETVIGFNTFEWNGSDCVDDGEQRVYKVSDVTPTHAELLKGVTVVVNNNGTLTEHTCRLHSTPTMVTFWADDSVLPMIGQVTYENDNGEESGLYLVSELLNPYSPTKAYVTSITFNGYYGFGTDSDYPTWDNIKNRYQNWEEVLLPSI